ncbi:Kar5p SKDI_13G1960 [Saccharomyces kudriavzevii IFO 1802]|uniref:Uncharacterized protein n=2 Tax=Saccharomyces kudriavzevii (strain ATCC MYA-4449 / AS 2.2408 / CBS 8840 / NBRC 1802 / NCYC 2889) TaxID=226230 RepID=A0AA35NKY3_SACK1|nr:uncharacterized protein SKDI_13G1960 [Saccharomyces kudriavzevii IFO 1802]EJT42316.1 KAR5-like protein [Saccharomyces kudriavzevii IFO 1802]CAI4048132.1 hypothetical protein SKDI_13G1960 [Saccharomyces kudriavzevii IFO 1802]
MRHVYLLTACISIVSSFEIGKINNQLQERLVYADDSVATNVLESKFPFLKSTCVKDALKSYLPQCMANGFESIDAETRVETAIKLSICEFQASGLGEIPANCMVGDLGSMMDCMFELESSSKWWTTYSGNYQRLSSICYENVLPYEKEQILKLFLNITELYDSFGDDINIKLNDLIFQMEQESEGYLNDLARMFHNYDSQLRNMTESNRIILESDLSLFRSKVNDVLYDTSEQLEVQIIEKNNQLLDNVNSIHRTMSELTDELNKGDMRSKIYDLKDENLNNLQDLVEMSHDVKEYYSRNNELVNAELENFLIDLKTQLGATSRDLSESQIEAIDLLQGFNSILHDSLLPSITNEIVPEMKNFKNSVLQEWTAMTSTLNKDFALWNEEIFSTFSEISEKLNGTKDKLNDIDIRISLVHKNVMALMRIFDIIWKAGKTIMKCGYVLLKNKYYWLLCSVVWIWSKYSTPWRYVKALSMKRFYQWGVVLLSIYLGARTGSLIGG